MGKGRNSHRGSAKDDRRSKKAEANRNREMVRRRGSAIDRSQLATFAGSLRANGLVLKEVERDGNCFFRSIADQLEGQQHEYDKYRQEVISYMEANEEDYCPFLTFGEGDEEDDKDFEEVSIQPHLAFTSAKHAGKCVECRLDVNN